MQCRQCNAMPNSREMRAMADIFSQFYTFIVFVFLYAKYIVRI